MASGDDLNRPLGLGGPPRTGHGGRFAFRAVVLAGGLVLVGGVVFLMLHGDPLGGEPSAVATITPQAAKQAATKPSRATGHAATITSPAGDKTAAQIESKSGVKIVRVGGAKPPAALIINVQQALAQKLAPAPDPRLVEKSHYGLLPRIGKDGARPADVYARPVSATADPNAPRLALVVGGVGLSDSATAAAINGLPGPVTLAFAPYGNHLKGQVTQAREAGHEVILQLPMQPIDYPHDNPGPHTLLVHASVAQNRDRLHWLMSRFSGYTGVANFLGGKFTSTRRAFRPVLREIAARGLFYLDDGSSAQSLGLSLAKSVGLQAARADLTVDTTADPTAVDANLAKLAAIARAKGVAIGMANDLPQSISAITRFMHSAQARGIVFVPLSAAVKKETKLQDAGMAHAASDP